MTDAKDVELLRIDALLPGEMAEKAERVGVQKTQLALVPLFALAFLAGAFIALGAIFATTVATGGAALPYGLNRLLMGAAFSLGLILVSVGGAELFTGNNLIIMAWASRKVKTRQLAQNWFVVYLGNFAGAASTAGVMFVAAQHQMGSGAVGETALMIAEAKCGLAFAQATALGAMCNVLVCLAVWLALSARSTTDRIVAIVPPITAFVAAGFEHSVANMYFIPIALLIKNFGPQEFWQSIGSSPTDFPNITAYGFIANMVPVTIGNMIGGVLMVGAVYWFIYLRPRRS